jgi:hypothetical protein
MVRNIKVLTGMVRNIQIWTPDRDSQEFTGMVRNIQVWTRMDKLDRDGHIGQI